VHDPRTYEWRSTLWDMMGDLQGDTLKENMSRMFFRYFLISILISVLVFSALLLRISIYLFYLFIYSLFIIHVLLDLSLECFIFISFLAISELLNLAYANHEATYRHMQEVFDFWRSFGGM
jgi:hypothetical protein